MAGRESLLQDLRREADALIAGDEFDREATVQLLVQAADEMENLLASNRQDPPPQAPGLRQFECPDCKAQQPEAGRCGRCPGVVQEVHWDAGACYICGVHVSPSDGWHREDYDGVSLHWCPDHQPVWSREKTSARKQADLPPGPPMASFNTSRVQR